MNIANNTPKSQPINPVISVLDIFPSSATGVNKGTAVKNPVASPVNALDLNWCHQWVHCTTNCLGLRFRGVWTLASAHVLCLPTIKVQVFHVDQGLKSEVQ